MSITFNVPDYDWAMRDKKAALAYLNAKKKGDGRAREARRLAELQKGKKCQAYNKHRLEWENGFIAAVVLSKEVGAYLYAIK